MTADAYITCRVSSEAKARARAARRDQWVCAGEAAAGSRASHIPGRQLAP